MRRFYWRRRTATTKLEAARSSACTYTQGIRGTHEPNYTPAVKYLYTSDVNSIFQIFCTLASFLTACVHTLLLVLSSVAFFPSTYMRFDATSNLRCTAWEEAIPKVGKPVSHYSYVPKPRFLHMLVTPFCQRTA